MIPLYLSRPMSAARAIAVLDEVYLQAIGAWLKCRCPHNYEAKARASEFVWLAEFNCGAGRPVVRFVAPVVVAMAVAS